MTFYYYIVLIIYIFDLPNDVHFLRFFENVIIFPSFSFSIILFSTYRLLKPKIFF